MKVHLRGPESLVTPARREQLERRLGLTLARFADRIAAVTVRLWQRGERVRCRIEVALRPRTVSVEDEDRDAERAAEFAIGRLDGRMALAIEREQEA